VELLDSPGNVEAISKAAHYFRKHFFSLQIYYVTLVDISMVFRQNNEAFIEYLLKRGAKPRFWRSKNT
jgi:hypothetical protein